MLNFQEVRGPSDCHQHRSHRFRPAQLLPHHLLKFSRSKSYPTSGTAETTLLSPLSGSEDVPAGRSAVSGPLADLNVPSSARCRAK